MWRAWSYRVLVSGAAFVYVCATFTGFEQRLYVEKWAAFFVLAGVLAARANWRINTDLWVPYLLLLGATAVGLIAQSPLGIDSRAIQLAVGFVLTPTLALLVGPAALHDERFRKDFWRLLLVGVIAGVVVGLVFGYLDPMHAFTADSGRIRYKGLFQRPNSVGWYGFVGFGLTAILAASTRRKRHLLWLPLFITAPALAGSRGALLAMLVFAAVWLSMQLGQRRAVVVRPEHIVVALCTIAVGFSFFLPDVATFSRPDGPLDRVLSSRLTEWTGSLAYLHGATWLVGRGMSQNISLNPLIAGVYGGESDSAYVDLIGRSGLLGLCLVITAAVMLTRKLFLAWRRSGSSRPELQVATSLFLSALAYAFVESHLLTSGTLHAVFIWTTAAWAAQYSSDPAPMA